MFLYNGERDSWDTERTSVGCNSSFSGAAESFSEIYGIFEGREREREREIDWLIDWLIKFIRPW